ncbi:hypothetical protein KAH94_05765 [bacterium]|nr:hypothetical protein [bacterium]
MRIFDMDKILDYNDLEFEIFLDELSEEEEDEYWELHEKADKLTRHNIRQLQNTIKKNKEKIIKAEDEMFAMGKEIREHTMFLLGVKLRRIEEGL